MNLRHSSTGKRVIGQGLNTNLIETDENKQHRNISIENLNISNLLQSPNASNRDALQILQEKIEKSKKDLKFPSIYEFKKLDTPRQSNSFLNVFPTRNSKVFNRIRKNSIQLEEELDYPKKYFHRKADLIIKHTDAMLRASDLFKLHKG